MGHERGPAAHQVILNGLVGVISEGHEAFLAPLAEEPHVPGEGDVVAILVGQGFFAVYVVDIGVEHFAHAGTGGVQEFKYGAVSQADGSVSIRHGEEALHLLHGNSFG